tara:strand:- start:2486 stop:2659 length:174 start_codon:yes stop_codon:yes gene_type:complete
MKEESQREAFECVALEHLPLPYRARHVSLVCELEEFLKSVQTAVTLDGRCGKAEVGL